jgi:hypothetical protein
LTTSFVAYGTDHNAELLKQMSEDVNGSYSIVTDLEGAALTMGETLGNLISCAAQNVTVQFPPGTKLLGGGRNISPEGRLNIGDLYVGVPQLLLVELPVGASNPVTVKGSMVPSLDGFQIDILEPAAAPVARDLEVELTEIRYKVADLYRRLRDVVGSEQRQALQTELEAIRSSLADPVYAGQPLLELLQHELPSLERAIEAAGTYLQRTHDYRTQLLQHEAFVALGRGTSQPMRLPAAEGFSPDDDGDAVSPIAGCASVAGDPATAVTRGPAARANASYMSPTASRTTQRVAAQLRGAASQPAAAP